MVEDNNTIEDDESRLFSEYGELVLLLEADPKVLHEPIKDATLKQKRRIVKVLEDQINDTHIEGNIELFMKFLYLWMYTIRQIDAHAGDTGYGEGFMLRFSDWEHKQFS